MQILRSTFISGGWLCCSVLLGSWALAAGARAQELSHENVVTLSASAQVQVKEDLLTVRLGVTKSGTEAASVQEDLKQVLDQALSECKKTASSELLQVQTGRFSIAPRYGRDGQLNGWQGSAELILSGTDVPRVAQAAGRVGGMTVSDASFSVSRQLLQAHQADLTEQAIAAFRARASLIAHAFGFSSYKLVDVNVQTGEAELAPRPLLQARLASSAMASAPLPAEAGAAPLSATVSGSVVLLR